MHREVPVARIAAWREKVCTRWLPSQKQYLGDRQDSRGLRFAVWSITALLKVVRSSEVFQASWQLPKFPGLDPTLWLSEHDITLSNLQFLKVRLNGTGVKGNTRYLEGTSTGKYHVRFAWLWLAVEIWIRNKQSCCISQTSSCVCHMMDMCQDLSFISPPCLKT